MLFQNGDVTLKANLWVLITHSMRLNLIVDIV